MDTVLDNKVRELSSKEMAAHRNHVHAEARERIGKVGGALRVSLNNMTVGSLREYIALSRHQLELSEYINIHTGGSDDPDDLWVDKIHWPDGNYYPYQVARRPVDEHEKVLPPIWAVEQLRDVMWRVKAVGSVLGRSGKHLIATDAAGITELSNHQCEIADFMRTGKFKKVPRRRKARYLGGDGTQSAETAHRVRELGEALKEYQGRIEIKTVREFIALSKHQCELAGIVIASEREMKKSQSIELIHYTDAYGTARQKTNDGNPPLSPLKLRGDYGGLWAVDVHSEQSRSMQNTPAKEKDLTVGSGLQLGTSRSRPEPYISGRQEVHGSGNTAHGQGFVDREISGAGYKPAPAKEERGIKSEYDDKEGYGFRAPVGKRPQERATGEDKWLVMFEPEGRVERHPSPARTRGESASPGVPFCDTFGHAKVSIENPDPACCGTGLSENSPCKEHEAIQFPYTPLPLVEATLREDSLREGGGQGGGDWSDGSPRERVVPTSPQSHPLSARVAHDKGGEERKMPLTVVGTILHPTGKPAENIRVQLDMGTEGENILSLDEITDREGRFSFHSKEVMHPPNRIIIRGELTNRLSNSPLPDAEVHITIDGDDGLAVRAVSDYRGRFASGEGAPAHRPRGEPLWTQVENDDGPQFFDWNMGWDDP